MALLVNKVCIYFSQKSSHPSDAKTHTPIKDASIKNAKGHYNADLINPNMKDGDRGKKRDYEDAGGKERHKVDDFKCNPSSPRHLDDWAEESKGYGRRKAPESFRNDDFYKPPSKSSRSEEYYYDDPYYKDERYELHDFRGQHKPSQSSYLSLKLSKKEKDHQDVIEPQKSSKLGIKDYKDFQQADELRRCQSIDSEKERDDYKEYKYEEREDIKPCSGSSNRNSESPDHFDLKYPVEKKESKEETGTLPKHHDNASERTRWACDHGII